MQETNIVELRDFFLKFKKRAHELRVNETKPDTENASNWCHSGFGVVSESKCDERTLFRVSLQNLDLHSKVGLLPSIKKLFCLLQWKSFLKMVKNAFYFILKAFFCLQNI